MIATIAHITSSKSPTKIASTALTHINKIRRSRVLSPIRNSILTLCCVSFFFSVLFSFCYAYTSQLCFPFKAAATATLASFSYMIFAHHVLDFWYTQKKPYAQVVLCILLKCWSFAWLKCRCCCFFGRLLVVRSAYWLRLEARSSIRYLSLFLSFPHSLCVFIVAIEVSHAYTQTARQKTWTTLACTLVCK